MSELKTVNESGALSSKSAGAAFSITTIATLVVMLITGSVIKLANISENTAPYLYISFLASPVALVAGMAISLKYFKQSPKAVFPVKCHPKYYFIALLLVFGGLFALGWTNDLTVKFFELFGYEKNSTLSYLQIYLSDIGVGELISSLLAFALIPAVFEEALFRGVILNNLEEDAGSVRAVFITGFCFSLFHTSPEQTVYQFISGCSFALVAMRAHSVLPGIMMHFINNALIVFLAYFHCCGADGALLISGGWSIALTVIAALCFIGGIVWLILDKKPLKKCKNGGIKNFFISASIAIFALAVLWVSTFFG